MQRGESPIFEYATAIISPILIMGMVGSLLFFLVQACYGGVYDLRLSFILAMFTLASVLIARIAIEEGRAYASLFAMPLALVTGLAIARFVHLSGPLASISFPVNMGLLGLIWWASDRLVFDCTLIDEQQDDSGSGLLQTIGLDSSPTETPDSLDSGEEASEPEIPNLFEWLFRHRRKKQQPGIWVLYFSLGAIPLFGIGQWFANAQTVSARRNIFQLLVVYLICSLTLLTFTSLLSLRRYLRQRDVDVPASISLTWIGGGGLVVFAVLLFSYLLPRRNAEYSVTHLEIATTNTERSRSSENASSENAVGNDGKLKGENPRTSEKGKQPSQETQKNGTQPSDKGNGKKTGGGNEKGKKGSASGKGKTDAKSDAAKKKSDGQKKNDGQDSNKSQTDRQKQAGEQKKKNASQTEQSRTGSNSTSFIGSAFSGLMHLIKFIYWLIAIAIISYLVWKNWGRIKDAMSKFWQQLMAWCGVAWFGKKKESAENETTGPARPTLSDFPNPFENQRATSMTPEQLIQYSYEALQAWAADADIRRHELTPYELANHVGTARSSLATDARNLANLVAQSAYSPDNVDPAAIDYLRSFWQNLSAISAPMSV